MRPSERHHGHRTGGTCEYLATGDRTEGRFGLSRWTFGEDESGPDTHFHRSISEQFYVLSGRIRLYDGWTNCLPERLGLLAGLGCHARRGW